MGTVCRDPILPGRNACGGPMVGVGTRDVPGAFLRHPATQWDGRRMECHTMGEGAEPRVLISDLL